ncbi:MAG: uroporphyrinogen-III synthase [Alphaproteobacteria bacterium]
MRVLLTRPREDSEALARVLAARGIDALVAPLLVIEDLAAEAPDLTGVQALLVTSANGARALARALDAGSPGFGLDVLTVGEGSAEAARDAGFARVAAAGGDVAGLAELVRARLDPTNGALLHAAGSVAAGDLAGSLAAAGYTVRRVVLYRARPARRLSAPARRAIAAGEVDAVLLFSPRTAATFAKLVRAAGLDPRLTGMDALCLSDAVARALAGLGFRRVLVAARPDQPAMLALLAP